MFDDQIGSAVYFRDFHARFQIEKNSILSSQKRGAVYIRCAVNTRDFTVIKLSTQRYKMHRFCLRCIQTLSNHVLELPRLKSYFSQKQFTLRDLPF